MKSKILGLLLGIIGFITVVHTQLVNIPFEPKVVLGILILCIFWWLFEVVPLGITGLFGLLLAVFYGIADVDKVFIGFSNPVILLMIGSFLIAHSVNKYGLDKRISLNILSKDFFIKSPIRLIIGFSSITFLLSMWLSNTATTAMMLLIVLGVVYLLKDEKIYGYKTFASFMLLSIAYSASIGGIGTIVGSPTNLVGLGFLKEEGIKIDFFQWMLLMLPIALSMYVIMILYIRFFLRKVKFNPQEIKTVLQKEKEKLPKISREEKIITAVFLLAVFLWVFLSFLSIIGFEDIGKQISKRLPESIVAVLCAGLLFLIPKDLKNYQTVLTVEDLKEVDWNTVILFASVISIGKLISSSGLGEIIAKSLSGYITYIPLLLFILIIAIILLTEINSNTATVITFAPIIIALLKNNQIDFVYPTLAIVVASSFAFMFPIATPPNAIVYSTGFIKLQDMVKFGLFLNAVGSIVIYLFLILLR
ncbi:MAG: SLC13 family permease [Sulfurihydrogenibium azorense]